MEQNITHTAIDNLNRIANVKATWKPAIQKQVDGTLVVVIENKKLSFQTEVKKEIGKHHFPHILELAATHKPFLLLAGTILPAVKETLRENGIAYLEANGNVFIKQEGIYLWIDAHKQMKFEKEAGNRAFTKTGLKVVFQFLIAPEFINAPYRQIAEITGTGIGNITNIINGLKDEGFLLPIDKNQYKLNNIPDLVKRWIAGYEKKLKPVLKIGKFRFLKQDNFIEWKKLPLRIGKTWWGGEPAGDLLTKYLKPAELTLYTIETRNELVKNYRLIPDENGNVLVYEKFWQQENVNENVVPALLVYADLMITNDKRCIETANKIYERYL